MELKGTFKGRVPFVSADGKIVYGSAYGARLSWLDLEVEVEIDSTEGNFALLGTGLLYECRVVMEPARGILLISRTG